MGIGLALLAVYLVWGSTYLAMRIGLAGGLPPFGMAGVRFVLAGGGLMLALRGRGVPAPTGAQWGGAAIVGGLLLGLGNGGVMFAEYKGVTSGLAALGVATVPLWTALLAGVWGQWPYRREWLGLAVGFAGIALLNLDGGLRASPVGAASLAVSALGWAFGSVWSRRLPLPTGAMAAGAQMLCGGVLLLGASLLRGEKPARAAAPAGGAWRLSTWSSGPSSATALILICWPASGLRLRPATPMVNPVVAVGLGTLLAGEPVGPAALAALVLILIGVGLAASAKIAENAAGRRNKLRRGVTDIRGWFP